MAPIWFRIYLTSVKDGGFYGGLTAITATPGPAIMPQRPDLVATATAPDYA